MKNQTMKALKAGIVSLAFLAPFASADIDVYPHYNNGSLSVQAYQDGKHLNDSTVTVTTPTGRVLKEGTTNQKGWANLGSLRESQTVKVAVTASDGSTAEQSIHLIRRGSRS